MVVSLSLSPSSGAVLQGAQLAVGVLRGGALWSQLILRGWPGDYTLTLSAQGGGPEGQYQIPPLSVPVSLLPCALGEQLDVGAGGSLPLPYTTCGRCGADQYGLWADARPSLKQLVAGNGSTMAGANGSSAASGSEGSLSGAATAALYGDAVGVDSSSGGDAPWACRNCPLNALCPGGPLLLPRPGYWHSAANSTLFHRCPNSDACPGATAPEPQRASGASTAAQRRRLQQQQQQQEVSPLQQCQQQWYASRPPGEAVLQRWHNGTSTDPTAAASPPFCLLWGLPASDPQSYMQQQCAEGYTGLLCGTCAAGWFLDNDFVCTRCPSLAVSGLLLAVSFAGSLLLVLAVAFVTFKEDNSARADKPGAAEVLKVRRRQADRGSALSMVDSRPDRSA